MAVHTLDEINEALYSCYDPEIPVNIMDLGLVYDVELDGHKISVTMTLTARGCPMSHVISADVKSKLEALPYIDEARVNIVWEPQWTPSMISPAGRKKLGME